MDFNGCAFTTADQIGVISLMFLLIYIFMLDVVSMAHVIYVLIKRHCFGDKTIYFESDLVVENFDDVKAPKEDHVKT